MLNIRLGFTALMLCFVFSLPTSAQFELFDFTGWDHSLITTVGQTFDNVSGDLDVLVEAIGAFDADSTYVMSTGGSMEGAIRSEQTGIGSYSFIFHFSEPIDAVVEFTRVDTQELLGIYGIGPEAYTHIAGNMPTTMTAGSGMTIQGNGFGPLAADGYVTTGPTSVLTVS